jgi:hypothetical protein
MGHEMLQRVAPALLASPAGHLSQLEPLCAINFPAGHATHVAAVWLMLPCGPTSPAAHGVPSQVEREPAVFACMPVGHGRQVDLQMQLKVFTPYPVSFVLHSADEALIVLK